MPPHSAPDRNLALELVRVTEAAALSAGRWMGRGDAAAGNRAAVAAMQLMLGTVDVRGTIVIGEDDHAPASSLGRGASIGSGSGPSVDVAVDAVDGSRLLALGRANALSVVAVAERGTMFDPGPATYLEKIAVGAAAASAIDIAASVEDNLRSIAKALRKDLDDLTIVVLDRPRHAELIGEVRATGARIRLIGDGDVAGAIMAAVQGTGVDALLGTGGVREGVTSACALRCLEGAMQCRLAPQTEAEAHACADAGHDLGRILDIEDLVASDNVFFAATGITDGELVRGVQYTGTGAETHSIVMRSLSGTIRRVDGRHRWDKLMQISRVTYDSPSPRVVPS